MVKAVLDALNGTIYADDIPDQGQPHTKLGTGHVNPSQKWDGGCTKSGTGVVPDVGHEGNPLNKSIKVKDTTPISPSSSKPPKQEVAIFGSDIDLPKFVNRELWIAFLDMRKKNKTPNTPMAFKLLISKLTSMHNDGQDANQAIEQSIMNGWKGVFPPKTNASKGNHHAKHHKPTVTEAYNDALAAIHRGEL